MKTVKHFYKPHGGVKQFFHCRDREVLLDGPAGTGKSRGVGEYLNWLAESFDGCRILICRDTRASLTDSFLVTFEENVLLPDSPLLAGPRREYRHSYEYENGSEIVLGGLDKPTRLYSTEWDIVYINEATETTEDAWEKFHRALRFGRIPWQQLIGDCNPDHPQHWLNLRCDSGKTTRILTRHKDNGRAYDHEKDDWTEWGRELMAGLEMLTGVRRERLLLGRWVAAEGAVWENYDPKIHLISQDELIDVRDPNAEKFASSEGRRILLWFLASVDWGFADAGVIQVWGFDGDGRMYRVHEVYRTQEDMEWWLPTAKALQERYQCKTWVCDPSRPEHINLFRKHGIPAREANNDVMFGIDQVRARLNPKQTGGPRLFLVKDALDNRDDRLFEKRLPWCTEQEIWGYVYRKQEDGKPIKEEPDPACHDHGCDTMRYAAVHDTKHVMYTPKPEPKYKPGTMGERLGHENIGRRRRPRT